MKIKIIVHANDTSLLEEIFDFRPMEKGYKKEINDIGVILEYNSFPSRKGLDLGEVFEIIVRFTSVVAINLFSNWLYEKIKTKTKKIIIGKNTETKIEVDSIKNAIEKNIE